MWKFVFAYTYIYTYTYKYIDLWFFMSAKFYTWRFANRFSFLETQLSHICTYYIQLYAFLYKKWRNLKRISISVRCAPVFIESWQICFFFCFPRLFLKKLVFVLRRKLFYQCVKNVASYVYNDKFPWNSQIKKKILLPQCRLFWNAIRNEKPS